jgi:hypothetical protein
LPPGAIVRVAVGWRRGDVFTPIAHSPALETPPASPSPILADVLLAWSRAGMVRIEETPAAGYLSRARGGVRKDAPVRRDDRAESLRDNLHAGTQLETDPGLKPEVQGSSEHAYA